MKKIISLFIAFALLVSCQKDNNGNQGNGKIAIKGTIPGKSQKKSAEISSLTDAKKVLVFSKYYYSLTDIVNGSFTVTGQIGTGVALIFLDVNNKYIGNLSAQGLNMLPLGSLSNG